MELRGHYQSSGPRAGVCVPSCWHHISRRLRREGEWLHVAGLLLQGAWDSPLLCISQTQTWGWSLFPSFPSSTANCTRKERCDGAPATLPEKRTTGKLRSLRVCGPQPPPRSCCGHCLPQGAVKTQGRGRAWAGGLGGQGGKPVSMQHQARLFGNKRNRKRGHIATGGT